MKKLLIPFLLVVYYAVLLSWAQANKRINLDSVISIRVGSNEITAFEDKETGTRCYAITSVQYHVAGYAMQCVAKGRGDGK